MLFMARAARVGATILFLLSYLLISNPLFVYADTPTQPTDWKAGTPAITQIAPYADSSDSLNVNLDCTTMAVPVVRNLGGSFLPVSEQHCMVATAGGLIDNQATIVQPNGYSRAYPLQNIARPGHPALVPVPHQTSALLVVGDTSYPGSDIGVYQNFWAHLHFNDGITLPYFTLSTDADGYIKYPNGRVMAFNTSGTLSFSDDGSSFLADAGYHGFVRVNTEDLSYVTVAQNLPLVNGYGLLSASTTLNADGSYAAIAYSSPGGYGDKYFKVIDVASCNGAISAYTAASTCRTAQVLQDIKTAIPGLKSVAKLRFVTDAQLLFTAVSVNGTTENQAQYTMTAFGQQSRREQYLAMGDSFISGEGAFAYRNGTDTGINKCHQSVVSYPYLLSTNLDSFQDVACSGAVIDNIRDINDLHKSNQLVGVEDNELTGVQKNTAKVQHTPGVVTQEQFVLKDNPQAITISIGGNDIGFGNILERCMIPFNFGTSTAQNCYQTYEDRLELLNTINAQFNNLYQTYVRLKASDPSRRVYVIGYPQIVKPDGDCALNVHLSKTETEFAAQLVSYLDSVIAQAAAKAGVMYVNTEHAFDGSRLCEGKNGEVAVNGLTAGSDRAHVIGAESYHPNQLGHKLLASEIAAATDNLQAPMPAPQPLAAVPVISDSLPILQAPKINRGLYNIINAGQDILYVTRGFPVTIPLMNLGNSISSGSLFDAVLHSDPVDLGPLLADSNGNITGSLTIPASTPPGIHTLHLYGKNKAGELIDTQQNVYVAATKADSDGDGIPDQSDSCMFIPNSGVDVDQDGVDDACDAVIAAAVVTSDFPPTDQQTSGEPTNTQEMDLLQSATELQNSPAATLQTKRINTIMSIEFADPATYVNLHVLGTENGHPPTSNSKSVVVRTTNSTQAHSPHNSWLWLLLPVSALLLIGVDFQHRQKQ